MKILNVCFAISVTILLSSCVMTKTYTDEVKKMRSQDGSVYVIKRDGSKVVGSKIDFMTRKSRFIKVDDQRIEFEDIIAYQDQKGSYAKFGNKKDWIWVKQLKRGKINLYYYDFQMGKNLETHFVFQKGKGRMLEMSITEIAEILQDNRTAYLTFVKQFGSEHRKFLPQLQNHPKVLFSAIDIYNG